MKAVGLTTVGATVIADKGYCSEESVAGCATAAIKTCVAVPKLKGKRRWNGQAKAVRRACAANLHRARSSYGRSLTRSRGATVEKSFQNVFDRGWQRRTHLRGHENNEKRNLIAVAAHNFGVLMRKLIGKACPKAFAEAAHDLFGLWTTSSSPFVVMATAAQFFGWRRRLRTGQSIAHSNGQRAA